jgi:hypothetical protein
LLLPVGAAADPADIVVDTTSDVADFGGAQQVGDLPGPDGKVSLREAIRAANNTPGPQLIGFAIPTSDPGFNGQWFTIRPASQLPHPPTVITDDGTTIDASTQTAFTGDTNAAGPEIELNGALNPSADGLVLGSSDNRVHGLAINGFTSAPFGGNGISISGSGNVVTGCYIGLDPTGSIVVANEDNGISLAGTGNRIGGRTSRERNVISGNRVSGFQVHVGGNLIEGNYIGTDRTGSVDLGNSGEGVLLHLSAPNNVVRGNLLSGNDNTGVFIAGKGNSLRANLIGTDATGTAPLGNNGGGVLLRAGDGLSDADGNQIIGNLVSANGQAGVWFASEPGVNVENDDNLVSGNLIGTDRRGNVAPGMGNSPIGVVVFTEGTGNVVGANVVGGNDSIGISISGDSTTVAANAIFEHPNYGLVINSGSGNLVRRNHVRANGVDGIYLSPAASGNSVVENFLRLNVEHDCHDDSVGSGTAGTANIWRRNNGQTSQPPGLCVPGRSSN